MRQRQKVKLKNQIYTPAQILGSEASMDIDTAILLYKDSQSKKYKDIKVIYPLHPNPAVKENAMKVFQNEEDIMLIEPLDVEDMHNL